MGTRFRVHRIRRPDRPSPWGIDYRSPWDPNPDGSWRRVKRFFDTKTERDEKAEELESKFMAWGAQGAATIPTADLQDYQAARQMLPAGVTLTAAALAYLKTWKPSTPTIMAATEDFLDDRRRHHVTEDWLAQVKRTMIRLAVFCPEGTRIDQVTAEQIRGFLDSLGGYADLSKNAFRENISNVMNYAFRREWILANPVRRVSRIRIPRSSPHYLSPDQFGKILAWTMATDPGMVLATALMGFAGIRTAEASRLIPADIDLKNRIIRLPGFRKMAGQARPQRVTKTGVPRVLEAVLGADGVDHGAGLPPVIWEWIREFPALPKMNVNRFSKRRMALAELAGVTPWPKNALRHTFTSYHVALNQSAERTQMILGHEAGSAVIWKHYRAIATQDQAREFFALTPERIRLKFRTILADASSRKG